MNGWKTYASAAALAVLGIVEIVNGDTMSGAQKIIGALALVGIGHKLDKATQLPGTSDNTGA
jgi:hypothetical protein